MKLFKKQRTGVRAVRRVNTSIVGEPETTTETLIYNDLVFLEPYYSTKTRGDVIGETGFNQSLLYILYFPKTITIRKNDFIYFNKPDMFNNVLYTNFTIVDGLTKPSFNSTTLLVENNPKGSLSINQIEVEAIEKSTPNS